jgi:hypothetical protein
LCGVAVGRNEYGASLSSFNENLGRVFEHENSTLVTPPVMSVSPNPTPVLDAARKDAETEPLVVRMRQG